MPYVIAQLSDLHVDGPHSGGERFTAAIDEINSMSHRPDLALFTGDLTHNQSPAGWDEFREQVGALSIPWKAIPGNHDRGIAKVAGIAGHRAVEVGPLRLLLLDTSSDVFEHDDATWLDAELTEHPDQQTVIAIHQPPFETGIWWMDCVGLKGAELFEDVVRRHRQVTKVLSGHVHRPIQTQWGTCSLWVCPSTSVSVAADLDPAHEPAETAEAPTFSLHAFTTKGVVSHLVPVGTTAKRTLIRENAPDFVEWAAGVQATRDSLFT